MTRRGQPSPTEPRTEPRAAPHNIEAEQALLCALMVKPNVTYERVSDFLEPEHFYDPLHRQIWDTSVQMIRQGQRPNPITLKHYFETAPPIAGTETVPQYLGRLAACLVSIDNARDYAKTIHDLALRRNLIVIAEDMINAAYDAPVDFPSKAQIEEAENRLYALSTGSNVGEQRGSVDFRTAALEAAAMAEAAAKQGAGGLSTGLRDLDAKTGGLFPTDLIILAGRPSMGKSALATNIAMYVARLVGTTAVDFYSLEMSRQQVALRILADELGVASEKFRTGFATQEEVEALFKKAHGASLPLYIDQTGGRTIAQLSASARRNKRRYGTGLIIVDYLQLLSGVSKKVENRTAEVSEITRELKALAKELNVPVLALSQLSREVEKRTDKRPQLSDLRESGSIEQDADVVMFVFRDEYYVERTRPAESQALEFRAWQDRVGQVAGKAEIYVAKQRHGPVGRVDLQFNADLMRFSDLVTTNGYAGVRQ